MSELFSIPIRWWIWPLHGSNYSSALHAIPFWTELRNTVFLSFSIVIGAILSSSFAAYGLAKIVWPNYSGIRTLPMIVIFFAGQRYFMQGISFSTDVG